MKPLHWIYCLILLLAWDTVQAQYVDLRWERIAHYPFSGDASDISGYENHALPAGVVMTVDRNGTANGAYHFDGYNDHIYCGTLTQQLASTVTVSCWIKTNEGQGYSHLVSKYAAGEDAGFILAMQDGQVTWGGRSGSGQFVRIMSNGRLDDGLWHHLIGVIEGTAWSLYVDGSLEAFLHHGRRRSSIHCSTPLTLGMYHDGDLDDHRFYSGQMDDVILFRRALNPCEIEALHTGNFHNNR